MPEYIKGAELDDTTITWNDPDGDPYDFSSGYTFTLKVGEKGQDATFTKTTGITGAATSPNVTVVWATTGELNSLAAGTHVLQLAARRTSDSRDLIMQSTIKIVEAVN
jgi:hypothetical protein